MFKRFDRVTVQGPDARSGVIVRVRDGGDTPYGVMFHGDLDATVHYFDAGKLLHTPPSPDRTTPITGAAKTIDGRIDALETKAAQPFKDPAFWAKVEIEGLFKRVVALEEAGSKQIDIALKGAEGRFAKKIAEFSEEMTTARNEMQAIRNNNARPSMVVDWTDEVDRVDASIDTLAEIVEKLKRRVKKLWRERNRDVEPGDDEKGQAEEYFRASDLVDVKIGPISVHTAAREFKPGDEVVVIKDMPSMLPPPNGLKTGQKGNLLAFHPMDGLWLAQFGSNRHYVDPAKIDLAQRYPGETFAEFRAHTEARRSAIISDNLKGAKIGEFLREWADSGFDSRFEPKADEARAAPTEAETWALYVDVCGRTNGTKTTACVFASEVLERWGK